jgi:hypothetical protein
MNIVGFNFTKISAERKRTAVGRININNNVTLKEISEAKIGTGVKGAVRVSFSFSSDYVPDFAKLSLEGDVLVLLEEKKAVEAVEKWGKNKSVEPQLAQAVMNNVLERCNIQALLLAKDLNLPSPVRMPQVQIQEGRAPAGDAVKTTKVEAKKKK